MLGAFDPVRRQLLVHASATKRSTDFVALLDQLGAAYGTTERTRPLVAVLDNGPIHTQQADHKGARRSAPGSPSNGCRNTPPN